MDGEIINRINALERKTTAHINNIPDIGNGHVKFFNCPICKGTRGMASNGNREWRCCCCGTKLVEKNREIELEIKG